MSKHYIPKDAAKTITFVKDTSKYDGANAKMSLRQPRTSVNMNKSIGGKPNPGNHFIEAMAKRLKGTQQQYIKDKANQVLNEQEHGPQTPSQIIEHQPQEEENEDCIDLQIKNSIHQNQEPVVPQQENSISATEIIMEQQAVTDSVIPEQELS